MNLVIKDKDLLKKSIRDVLSQTIPKPNKNILSVTATYDPNLDVVTLRCSTLEDEENKLVLDEKV